MFTTDRRLQLQALLEQALGSDAVYFQAPSNVQGMQYPCIIYSLDNARTEFAGNMPYFFRKRYQVMVVHDDPDSDIPDKIAWMQSAIFDRRYTANNLHHSVYTLYF